MDHATAAWVVGAVVGGLVSLVVTVVFLWAAIRTATATTEAVEQSRKIVVLLQQAAERERARAER